MTRYRFGGAIATWVFALQDAEAQYGEGVQVLKIAPDVTVTFWDSPAGGNQYTDLQDLTGGALTSVVTDDNGVIPEFMGPDEVIGMYAEAVGPRLWIPANNAPGPKGDRGDPGPTGPGEPIIYYNRTTSTYPPRPAVAGVHKYAGPVFPNDAVEGDVLRLEPA